MNKFETYQYLRNHNISFEAIEHPAVFNMEEAAAIDLPYPECEAKTCSCAMIKDAAIT